jgi:hypothetical protein
MLGEKPALGLKPSDVGAYLICNILGLLVFFWLMPNIYLATMVSVFLSFHLFLAWLVISADHETGFSLPLVSSIVTHIAFLVVVYLCSALLLALPGAMRVLPIYLWFFLRPIRIILGFGAPGMAIYERYWLFSGGATKKEVPLTAEQAAVAAETAAVADAATANDYDEWLQHVKRQKPPFPKPGSSLKAEYERWLLARAKARAAVPSNATAKPE